MQGLILKENSFQFNGQNYLQTHGTTWENETKLIQQNDISPREWKRYIDDVFSLWDRDRRRGLPY